MYNKHVTKTDTKNDTNEDINYDTNEDAIDGTNQESKRKITML